MTIKLLKNSRVKPYLIIGFFYEKEVGLSQIQLSYINSLLYILLKKTCHLMKKTLIVPNVKFLKNQ
jgi:hypothetical protein